MNENEYININKVAEAKGLKSNRSLRLEINKPESKYVAREVKVNGGTSYEILYSSLEPEIQQKLREGNTKSTALVPLNYQPTTFVSESARLTSLARLDIVKALLNYRKKFTTKKEADSMFLDLYNSGMYLPKVFKFIGTISIGTLHRWVKSYERYENAECLIPQYKFNKQGEYNTILTDEMKHILLRFLLHQNKFNYTLKNIKGRFLLSYDDSPKIRELYKGFEMVEVERLNGINNREGTNRENKIFKELLIANYPIKEIFNNGR